MKIKPNELGKNMPLVSVIVPVFNGKTFLAESIKSIQNQTYPHIEIIVVDDGSTDGTEEVIRSFPSVISIYQAHSGLSAALNNGIKNAKGDFIAFLDADDLWVKDKLWNQMRILIHNPEIEAVFGHIVQFSRTKENCHNKDEDTAHKISGYCKGSMLIKKQSFLRIGFFDTQWKVGDFIDWYKRAKEKDLNTLLMPEIVMKRRIHNHNMGLNKKEHKKDYVRILKAAMDRRRKNITKNGDIFGSEREKWSKNE